MESVISKREVPKDLQGLGVGTGFDAPDVQHTRLVITGQPGSGKSTLLNSNEGMLMLDPEWGGNTAADPKALRWPSREVAAAMPPDQVDLKYAEFVDKIIARKRSGRNDINMVGVDTYDEMILQFQKALCLREKTDEIGDVRGGHGKGYFMVRDAIFDMLDKLYRAGIGWALIAHTKVQTVKVGNEEKQVSVLSVSDSYKAAAFQKCEHMLFLERGIQLKEGKTIRKKVGNKIIEQKGKAVEERVRKLKTKPGGLWKGGETEEVKVRVPLQDEFVLPKLGGWDAFAGMYNEAVERLMKGEGNVR